MRVCRVDLIERAEAAADVIAGICQPVLRLFLGIQQTFECNLRVSRGVEKTATEADRRQRGEDFSDSHSFRPHFVPTLVR